MLAVVYGFPKNAPEYILSNFSEGAFTFFEYTCWTGEAAFQLCKQVDRAYRLQVAAERDPQRAKDLGRSARLRQDWNELRFRVMIEVIRAKARGVPAFKAFLLSTGSSILVEANRWRDFRWGVVQATGLGHNWLGIALMFVRAELFAESHAATGALDVWQEDFWPRFPVEDAPHEDWSPQAIAAGRYPRALLDDGTLNLAA